MLTSACHARCIVRIAVSMLHHPLHMNPYVTVTSN